MNKKILHLALPNILSNLTVPLLGIVDTALAGHLGDAAYLAGLALGGTIFSFLFWGFGFLRMGTTGLSAQAWGAVDRQESQHLFLRAALFAVLGGIALLLLQVPVLNIALKLYQATPEAEQWAALYFYTRIWAAPATLMLYVVNGWALGAQNAKLPLLVTVVQNVGNTLISLLLVMQYDMGIEGIALGTVIGNYAAVSIGIYLLRRKYPWLFENLVGSWLSREKMLAFFRLNSDIFIRTLALIAAFTWFTAESATYGDVPLAANSILMQLWLTFSYAIDGFAYAAESLTGRFKGAKDLSSLKRIIRLSFIWGFGLGLAGGLIYLVGRNPILHLFTNDAPTIAAAKDLYYWMLLAPAIGSFCYIWDGIYIGLTASAAMRNSMLFAAVVVYFPTYFLLESTLGIHALWLALTAFLGARALSQWWLFRKYDLTAHQPST